MIRRFQTAAEREAEGRRKGYSGVLEADLWRAEAKVEALSNPSSASLTTYRRGRDGEIIAEEKGEMPRDKEEGEKWWRDEMGIRFLKGEDKDFEYEKVDCQEEWDDWGTEGREREEKWFEEEEPQWVRGDGGEGEEHQGETGVQDF